MFYRYVMLLRTYSQNINSYENKCAIPFAFRDKKKPKWFGFSPYLVVVKGNRIRFASICFIRR